MRRPQRFAGNRTGLLIGGVILIGVVLCGIGFGCSSLLKGTERDVTATVDYKERVCDNNGNGGTSCKYLVFTDEGTFEITDSLVFGRFSSSDVYGRMREGKTYEFTVAGFRQPVLSMYPNIVSDPVEVTR